MAKASQSYIEGVGELTREFSDFLNTRLKHDVELGETMSSAKDWARLPRPNRNGCGRLVRSIWPKLRRSSTSA